MNLSTRRILCQEKGIVYIEQIEEMKEACSAAAEMGFRAIALWSPNNVANPITEEQMAALNHIIDYERVPQ